MLSSEIMNNSWISVLDALLFENTIALRHDVESMLNYVKMLIHAENYIHVDLMQAGVFVVELDLNTLLCKNEHPNW